MRVMLDSCSWLLIKGCLWNGRVKIRGGCIEVRREIGVQKHLIFGFYVNLVEHTGDAKIYVLALLGVTRKVKGIRAPVIAEEGFEEMCYMKSKSSSSASSPYTLVSMTFLALLVPTILGLAAASLVF